MNKGVRMGFLMDKVILNIFLLSLKTKRIAKSAIHGKLNYKARTIAPYFVGLLLAAWLAFIYFI